MLKKLSLIALLVALCAASASATVWDAYSEFSGTSTNPIGAWSYGYYAAVGSTMNLFDYGYDYESGALWTRSYGGNPDYNPYIHQNRTLGSLNLCSGTGGDDYFTIVRWTAAEAGWYQVDAVFEMMKYSDGSYWPGEMDIHVVVNSASVYDNFIAAYDYTPWGAPEGYKPGPLNFSGYYYLAAGGTVDYVGGPGWVDFNYDFVNIAGSKVSTAVPEPSSILALMCGVAGMAGYIRRKRA